MVVFKSWSSFLIVIPAFILGMTALVIAQFNDVIQSEVRYDTLAANIISRSATNEVQQLPLSLKTQPAADAPRDSLEPYLEPGFPVKALHTAGSYHGGPAIHTLVGNIDADPELEIIATALANGPIYAWNFDGSQVRGWPITGPSGDEGYPAMGRLLYHRMGLRGRRQIFIGFSGFPGTLAGYRGDGTLLPGWPLASANYIATPPMLGNVVRKMDESADSIWWRFMLDEIFIEEEDWAIHGYTANGKILPGWPIHESHGGQERHTPAMGDLDGDGDIEIVTCSGGTSEGVYIFAYHHDGQSVTGFPVNFGPNTGYPDTFVAIGDVDGDHELELVVVIKESAGGWHPEVKIIAGNGVVERTFGVTGHLAYGTAPALADLDGDSIPEIIVQSDGTLDVWYGDGTPFPGWPVTWSSSQWIGNSAPVVGDVDGDQEPDIVVTSQIAGSSTTGELRVYNKFGVLHSDFPKTLNIGAGSVPAIADFDRDGRNEIIVVGSYWNGISGMYDKCWVYDLGGYPSGRIEWGQFGGGPSHKGLYFPLYWNKTEK